MTHCCISYQLIVEYILVVFSYKLAEVSLAYMIASTEVSITSVYKSIENRIRLYPKKDGLPLL